MEYPVPVRSLKKALDLLDLIIEADLCETEATLGGLARRMKLRANSVHNLLKTMEACGYVEKTGHGVYRQGLKCRQLGLLNRLGAAVRTRLKALAAQEGEACVLATLVNGARVVVSSVDSTQSIQVSHAILEDRPFFSLATGRILAATANEEELRQIVERHGLPGKLWNHITSAAALRTALEEVRKQGWCRVDTVDGLVGMACPVCGPDGQPWGALGLYAPAFRCPPAQCERLAQALCRAAGEFSAILPTRQDLTDEP
jgi:IclR family acetate operon transcriptional repressor